MDSELQAQYVSFVFQAVKAKQAGDAELARTLMDKAILVLNETGIKNPSIDIFRELLFTDITNFRESGWNHVEEEIKNAYAFYEQESNILGQIDSLLKLAGLWLTVEQKEGARKYVDEANALIHSANPEDVNHRLPSWSILTGEGFLKLRQAEVDRIREFAM